MATTGGGLSLLHNLNNELDDAFKDQLKQFHHAASMYELLYLPNANLISSFICNVLDYYNIDDKCFQFGDNKLTITLEDVLYITGCPFTANR